MREYIEMEANFSWHITALSEVKNKVASQQRNVDQGDDPALANFFEVRQRNF